MSTKLDLKKTYADLYTVSSKKVSEIVVPPLQLLSLEGKGDPNRSVSFKKAIEVLYALSYTLKFMYKKLGTDYTVMPLEGLWWAEDMSDFSAGKKDNWFWKIFIVHPDVVTKDAYLKAVQVVKEKKHLELVEQVSFKTFAEGNAAQILHVGPFSTEEENIQKIHDYIQQHGYTLQGKHHEIYLNDSRKTAPEKLKTIIRQPFNVK
jgi:hypothetical protein